MSMERKELIKRLDAYFTEHLIMASQEVRDLFREVRAAIQQKSNVDEEYVKEMAEELLEITRYGRIPVFDNKVAERFITQIISDVRGGKT